jgi:hypothetical protein
MFRNQVFLVAAFLGMLLLGIPRRSNHVSISAFLYWANDVPLGGNFFFSKLLSCALGSEVGA